MALALIDNSRLGGADARLISALLTNQRPLERVAILLASVALVDARTLHEATEDEERLVVDLGKTVIIARLGHITCLL